MARTLERNKYTFCRRADNTWWLIGLDLVKNREEPEMILITDLSHSILVILYVIFLKILDLGRCVQFLISTSYNFIGF